MSAVDQPKKDEFLDLIKFYHLDLGFWIGLDDLIIIIWPIFKYQKSFKVNNVIFDQVYSGRLNLHNHINQSANFGQFDKDPY